MKKKILYDYYRLKSELIRKYDFPREVTPIPFPPA